MQVGESTLKELIEGEKQFQVPLYQRQYAWGSPQLSQLWEDVLEQYDVITPDDFGKLDGKAPTHFLGSLVLAPSPLIQAHGVTPFLVIDGQQRLTTLLVAMCALRDHVAANDPSAVERFNERRAPAGTCSRSPLARTSSALSRGSPVTRRVEHRATSRRASRQSQRWN